MLNEVDRTHDTTVVGTNSETDTEVVDFVPENEVHRQELESALILAGGRNLSMLLITHANNARLATNDALSWS